VDSYLWFLVHSLDKRELHASVTLGLVIVQPHRTISTADADLVEAWVPHASNDTGAWRDVNLFDTLKRLTVVEHELTDALAFLDRYTRDDEFIIRTVYQQTSLALTDISSHPFC